MKNRTLLRIISLCGLGLLYAAGVFAQDYPDVIWVPVTFYDFHSDRSNPEFEQRHMTADPYRTGMVARTLDAEGKPQLGSNPYMNYYIKYWFRPWESAAKGDFTGPHYSPRAGYMERYEGGDWVKEYQEDITYLGVEQLDHDTSFKNIVIEDSLPFEHLGGGVYQYSSEDFFPLDNRGFGNEWNHELGNVDYNREQGINPNHNYSFTMELHWQFVKKPGMIFDFEGDDDVFVFVNRELVLEIGGIHQPAQASFNVDNVGGLVNGRQYDLHVFYAERHSALSTIKITTNIISAPADMGLYPKPSQPDVAGNEPYGDRIEWTVGEPLEVYAHLFDSSKAWRPDLSEHVTWTIEGDPSLPGTINDPFISLTPTQITEPTKDLVITATFRDPNNPDAPPSIKTLRIKVNPGPPTQLDIQADSAVVSWGAKDDFNEIYFRNDETYKDVWVVLRDQYGNYVRHASNAQWQSLDGEVATVDRMTGSSARVIKRFTGVGEETYIIVTDGNYKPDTIAVGSIGEKSMAIGPNPFVPGKSSLRATFPPKTIDFYRDVIGEDDDGLLVAIDAPKPLKPNPNNPKSFGKVVIYDCVGNIVYQSDEDLKQAKAARSYGFVWDGKNNRRRTVGPGVYLVRISGVDIDGNQFFEQKKAGVTTE